MPLRRDRRPASLASPWLSARGLAAQGVVGTPQTCNPAQRKASVGTGCGSQGWEGSGPGGQGELRPKQGGWGGTDMGLGGHALDLGSKAGDAGPAPRD